MNDRELSQNKKSAWSEALHAATSRQTSVKALAESSGVKASTIYKIRDGLHNPTWRDAGELIEALPNTAVNDLLRPYGLAVMALSGKRCDHTTLAAFCRTAAEFADALEDGRIDRLEYGKMRPFVEGVRNLADVWLAEQNPESPTLTLVGKIR